MTKALRTMRCISTFLSGFRAATTVAEGFCCLELGSRYPKGKRAPESKPFPGFSFSLQEMTPYSLTLHDGAKCRTDVGSSSGIIREFEMKGWAPISSSEGLMKTKKTASVTTHFDDRMLRNVPLTGLLDWFATWTRSNLWQCP